MNSKNESFNESRIEDSNILKLSGIIESVIYSNEENGYTVCEMSTDNDDLITITGIMPYVDEGESLTVYGEWKHNPRYGRQFSVTTYEKFIPQSGDAILRYLSSGAVKGIGKKTARKIYDRYGDESMEVIENHPDWLSDIPGISLKKAREISDDFKEKSGIRSAMMFFGEFFGAAVTVRIYKRYGADAVEIAKENPYRLCDEIDGIGFERADNMAEKLGIDKNSKLRLLNGIRYVLYGFAPQNGHVCLPRDILIAESSRILGCSDTEAVDEAIDDLIELRRAVSYMMDGVEYIYDKHVYDCEDYISQKLLLLDKICPSVNVVDIDMFIREEERKSGFTYGGLQKQAIWNALESGVMIITGGPGTGKTTIVKALLDIFISMDMRVALSAPTGRAAKRLSESTSYEAKTIHRLLEYEYVSENEGRSGFRKNEQDLLEDEVIIVDEASMIDNFLMSSLLRAVKPGARIIIIGDCDQLPSVGAGNVLSDLLECGKFSVVRLDTIFRQAEQSMIVTNAHKINKGENPVLGAKDNDFFYLLRNTDAEIAYTIADLCKNRLPSAYKVDALKSIQVITPSRRGEAGTENLNVMMQEWLNPKSPSKHECKVREIIFREGDRVMQIKNDYCIEWTRSDGSTGNGVFNGDIGIIKSIDRASEIVEIEFDDKLAIYEFGMLDELDHAYAVTVHKSQGSEYPIVIIPLYNAPPMLLTRNLFYTAVTRAQKMVVLVGKAEIASTMVKNNRHSKRYTGLLHRLKKA